MQCNAMQYNVILPSAWRCRRTWRVTPTRRSGPPGGDRITEQLRREILAEKRSGSDARSSHTRDARARDTIARSTSGTRRSSSCRRAAAPSTRGAPRRRAAAVAAGERGCAVGWSVVWFGRRAARDVSRSSRFRARRGGASSLPFFFRLGWSLVLHRIDDASDASRHGSQSAATARSVCFRNRAAVGLLRRVVGCC